MCLTSSLRFFILLEKIWRERLSLWPLQGEGTSRLLFSGTQSYMFFLKDTFMHLLSQCVQEAKENIQENNIFYHKILNKEAL